MGGLPPSSLVQAEAACFLLQKRREQVKQEGPGRNRKVGRILRNEK